MKTAIRCFVMLCVCTSAVVSCGEDYKDAYIDALKREIESIDEHLHDCDTREKPVRREVYVRKALAMYELYVAGESNDLTNYKELETDLYRGDIGMLRYHNNLERINLCMQKAIGGPWPKRDESVIAGPGETMYSVERAFMASAIVSYANSLTLEGEARSRRIDVLRGLSKFVDAKHHKDFSWENLRKMEQKK